MNIDIDINLKEISQKLIKEKHLTPEQVEFLDQNVINGYWGYDISTKKINVYGSFLGGGKNMKDLKGINFDVIRGSFDISFNSFTNLEGFPRVITGSLDLRENPLISLKGIPELVAFDIYLPQKIKHIETIIRTIMSYIGVNHYSYEVAIAFVWDNLNKEEKDFFIHDLPTDYKEMKKAHEYGIY